MSSIIVYVYSSHILDIDLISLAVNSVTSRLSGTERLSSS